MNHDRADASLPAPGTPSAAPAELGICQWFHWNDERTLDRSVALLEELGVRHVRTGISWADYFRPEGPRWAERILRALSRFEVLLSVWHTPPSISERGTCASPPRRLRDYADVIDRIVARHGGGFTHLELWNEPNNRMKWDFENCDPYWRKFAEMVGAAAYWARQLGKPTVLGGMIPIDPHWLDLMNYWGVLRCVDRVAIHGFPGMWWSHAPNWDWHEHWEGWPRKIAAIARHAEDRSIWITETGLATWDLQAAREARWDVQVRMLELAARAPAERVYWYSLLDLDPARSAIEGFHVDENEYHLGLVKWDGMKKDAWYRMRELCAADRARRGRTLSANSVPGR